jgi:hypothetical protein
VFSCGKALAEPVAPRFRHALRFSTVDAMYGFGLNT